jgi:hypothetical protein
VRRRQADDQGGEVTGGLWAVFALMISAFVGTRAYLDDNYPLAVMCAMSFAFIAAWEIRSGADR